MTMNSSGPISLAGTTAGQSIEIENGGNGTTQISLNDTAVRTLAGVPSGAITMPTNFYGKSNSFTGSYTFSTTTANASLNISSISGYIAGKSNITVYINSGVTLYSTSTSGYGLNITGGTSGDTLTIVNNGKIIGQGGSGGATGNGNPGGTALNIGTGINVTVTNTSGYIAGGGGGGGTGNFVIGGTNYGVGGQGAGQGSGSVVPGTGGAGAYWYCCCGTTYTVNATQGTNGNYGGSVNSQNGSSMVGGAGGAGGSSGGSGTTGAVKQAAGGGGGGWGASGGTGVGQNPGGGNSYPGGAGGKGVALNGKTVTWTGGSSSTSRVYGAIA